METEKNSKEIEEETEVQMEKEPEKQLEKDLKKKPETEKKEGVIEENRGKMKKNNSMKEIQFPTSMVECYKIHNGAMVDEDQLSFQSFPLRG